MLTAVKGTYNNGQIILHETPPIQEETEVIVTFLERDVAIAHGSKANRRGGSMKGEVWMAEDFNAPLDDLTDYM